MVSNSLVAFLFLYIFKDFFLNLSKQIHKLDIPILIYLWFGKSTNCYLINKFNKNGNFYNHKPTEKNLI